MNDANDQAAVEWRAAFERVRAMVTEVVDADGEQAMQLTVPACPGWTAHDLLAHMVGLVVDVLGGDEPDDHNAGWTRAQVDARRASSSLDVLAEWEARADAMEGYLREEDARPLGDAIIHEQDLRGALDQPGARDTAGLAAVRVAMAERLVGALGDRPPVELRSLEWTWRSDGGSPEAAVVPGVVLEASGFDLLRALTSRRTAAELGSYVVAGDVAPYLDLFAQLGDLPERSLSE